MNDKNDTIKDGGEFEVGGEFSADLKSIYEPRQGVPAGVDRAILNEARKRIGKKRSRLRFARWAVSAGAAAAVIVFAFVHNFDKGPGMPALDVAVKEDVDRNGRVDILDAFVMARGIKSAGEDDKWDMNGDGVVDTKDVDVVAARAVRLGSQQAVRIRKGA